MSSRGSDEFGIKSNGTGSVREFIYLRCVPMLASVLLLVLVLVAACSGSDSGAASETHERGTSDPTAEVDEFVDECKLQTNGYGGAGSVSLKAEKVVTGLIVPWGIAFINGGDFLVTERPGRVRLVENGNLISRPVITLDNVNNRSESGLLGIAIHPLFSENRFFYLYYTTSKSSGNVNRVERYKLATDSRSANVDRMIIDDIPAGVFHDGGRIRFGPDGMLYVATGDARSPNLSQNRSSLAGKLLRLDPDGGVPSDNPIAGNPLFILGVRNLQAFDWVSASTLVLADHGPSGELNRRGHDEVSIARKGDNLGWPDQWRCQQAVGRVRPFLVWAQAMPPGGLVRFIGTSIPEFENDILVTSLGARHLHRIVFTRENGKRKMKRHEVYFRNQFGRLRDIVQAPDGSLYVTTSNCDGRGSCGSERDAVIRITKE